MANVQLNVPVLTGGILNTNFFNGRVLAAEDLTALQTAGAQQRRQLGRAIGDGVTSGLEVTLGTSTDPSATVLHVTAGLALDRKGDAVALSTDVDVAITTTFQVQSATNGLFAACQPPQGMIATNLDCYILTISPASGMQGSAPMTGATTCGFAASCGSANVVEGVQFNLLPLGVSNTSITTPLRSQALQLYSTLAPQFVTLVGLTGAAASNLQAQIAPTLSQFQNVVAHLCFGTDVLQEFAVNPFAVNPFAVTNGDSQFADYGVLGDLRTQGYLTDCAVPLALVYWTAAGVQFVDMWSVRRPVFPVAASEVWPLFSGRRRMAEGIAMFLQFQDQLANLLPTLGTATQAALTASNYFQYLPAMGLLPIAQQTSAGLNADIFFTGVPHREPEFMDGSLLLSSFNDAAGYPALDLSNSEMVWLYKTWQSEQSILDGASVQKYVVFTSPHMPYLATPRFDVARWDFSNYPTCRCGD